MPVLNMRVAKEGDGRAPEPAPEELTARGPLFPVTLTLPDAVQSALREQGKSLPEPVTGFALIDTGATRSCFDESAARKAGMPIRGTAKMASASHPEHDVPVFSGKMILGNLSIDVDSGMGVNLSGFPELVALIGRDLLANSILVYNGPDGSVSLAL